MMRNPRYACDGSELWKVPNSRRYGVSRLEDGRWMGFCGVEYCSLYSPDRTRRTQATGSMAMQHLTWHYLLEHA